jgi:hypothetical protein
MISHFHPVQMFLINSTMVICIQKSRHFEPFLPISLFVLRLLIFCCSYLIKISLWRVIAHSRLTENRSKYIIFRIKHAFFLEVWIAFRCDCVMNGTGISLELLQDLLFSLIMVRRRCKHELHCFKEKCP